MTSLSLLEPTNIPVASVKGSNVLGRVGWCTERVTFTLLSYFVRETCIRRVSRRNEYIRTYYACSKRRHCFHAGCDVHRSRLSTDVTTNPYSGESVGTLDRTSVTEADIPDTCPRAGLALCGLKDTTNTERPRAAVRNGETIRLHDAVTWSVT